MSVVHVHLIDTQVSDRDDIEARDHSNRFVRY